MPAEAPSTTPIISSVRPPNQGIGPITIRVLENAQIANGDPQAIAATVAALMPGIVNRIRRTNYQDSRLYSRYTPVTS